MSDSVSNKAYKDERRRAYNNARRAKENDVIRGESGLSSKTKIVKLSQTAEEANPTLFFEGDVALVDKDTRQVIFSVRFIDLNEEPEEFVNELKQTVSIVYKHTTARNLVTKNHAVVALPEHERSGEMYAMGITGGRSDGTKAAPYCLNEKHGSSTTLIAEDNARLDLLPRIERFIGDLFMQQCTLFYGCNLRVSEILNVPSFASTSPFTQPNGVSYGGSLVLTRDQFVNAPHDDKDSTDYAVGLFGTVDRNTGIPIHLPKGVPHRVIIRNSLMRFPKYNAEIVLAQPNIIVLLTWNVRVKHHTLRSTTHFQDGTITDPKTAKVTQIGSSIQVNKKLADQMRDFYVPRDDEEFAVISPKYSSSQEEYSRKQAGARK